MTAIAMRIGGAILEAHSQWEKENNRRGGQLPWTEPHVELLGRIALFEMRDDIVKMLRSATVNMPAGLAEQIVDDTLADRRKAV